MDKIKVIAGILASMFLINIMAIKQGCCIGNYLWI